MCYALMNMASKMVYYVLRRGGGGVKLWSKWCYIINEQPLGLKIAKRSDTSEYIKE